MTDPMEISVGKRNTGAENVKHEYYMVHAKDRYEALKRIADINPKIYSIVFCRTRMETKDVADKLIQDGYNADALHGDLSQAQRDNVMDRFRRQHLQILVATDVAARGLDVSDLTHVINYNLPDELEVYIHRSGRTGRAGKNGISVSIIHTRESNKIKSLEKLTGKKFEQRMVPGGKEICEKQLFSLIDIVENIEVNNEQISEFMPVIYKKLAWLDREELIKHFVSVEFNRFLTYYENAPDINVDESHHSDRDFTEQSGRADRRDRGRRNDRKRDDRRVDRRDESGSRHERGGRGGKYEFSRFFFSMGKKNGIGKRTIIDMINQQMPGKNVEIGNIEVLKGFSFFEVDKRFEHDVIKAFKDAKYKGQRIGIEVAKGK